MTALTNEQLRSRTYSVELLYDAPPELDETALVAALQARLPAARLLGRGARGFSFSHPDLPLGRAGARELQAQSLVGRIEPPPFERLAPALQQSWRVERDLARLAACRGALLVSELGAHGPLAPAQRLGLVQALAAAVASLHPPRLLHWPAAQELTDGAAWCDGLAQRGFPDLAAGGLNVRLFKVEDGRPGEMLMDTMGLAVLGLPDVQCHFHGLPREEVAQVLFSTAAYLFQHGDVIADGHTVPSHDGRSRWACRHEAALAAPERGVLDLDPEEAHSVKQPARRG